ncbi:DUF732 domain-containing protein [Mycobacterium conspicuum]|jgi:hypothetical protein|uniref:Uncharacterized protein n=1 Tax=Mycobacterium conspicuum TaxID=44010 RepID=A0A1X1TI44_9MYCO|nr:DUF732 domain-containing protein [Mycobacterium conspicuum]ORV44190.1 hypothetical protein AWC00_07785 [Mycobacterium conspicuum]BBZ41004.1 hypothetical protein MCNS_40670 [Mycobacterium conspicuum]
MPTAHPVAKVLIAVAVLAVGSATPAGAQIGPAPQRRTVQDFFAAVRAAGIVGTDPAMLADGYDVCWRLWRQHSPAKQVAAAVQRDHPPLTAEQAKRFVIAAYQDLCPVPGAYDWWAYGTS